ncbi:MAG: hypothetical protein KF901_01565 [Myxococcales bacterium]|nr:hypothetical protein [Myxococcales bacterium]
MTSDEARDRFSDAYEGELSAEEQAAFDAALAADEALAAEYDDFRAFLEGTSALAGLGDLLDLRDDPSLRREFLMEPPPADAPDLLPGVQKKLRERSRGRYYRDRFAERSKLRAFPLVLGIIMVLILALSWFGLSYVQLELEAEPLAPIEDAGER